MVVVVEVVLAVRVILKVEIGPRYEMEREGRKEGAIYEGRKVLKGRYGVKL